MITRRPTTNQFRVPALTRVRVAEIALGSLATMPANMMREMPLPMPFSVICSPSHMRNEVPAVRVSMVMSLKPQPPV